MVCTVRLRIVGGTIPNVFASRGCDVMCESSPHVTHALVIEMASPCMLVLCPNQPPHSRALGGRLSPALLSRVLFHAGPPNIQGVGVIGLS